MKKIVTGFLIAVLFPALITFAQKHGHLVIVGGVQVNSIVEKYVELAGGKNANIIVIPNAGSEPEYWSKVQVDEFKQLGANADYLMFNRETADSKENLEKMSKANAVFFLGGDQSDLTRDMLGTKLLDMVFDIYKKGGVVGGSSAGAAVMSEVMLTGNELKPIDSTDAFLTIKRGNIETKQGFGFLTAQVIDQHFLKRKRHNRIISVILEHPKLIGIAIDESTAIHVMPDDTFEVLGDNQVVIYDARGCNDIKTDARGNLGAAGMKMHLLINGDKFDLKTGSVIK